MAIFPLTKKKKKFYDISLKIRRKAVYAIVRSGGKQYKISPGDTIRVEKMAGRAGDTVEMKEVLLFADGDQIFAGTPVLSDVTVVGQILGQQRAKKVLIFKMKRRKGYSKKTGHRQSYTTLRIKEINRP
jgi:large subunit ribosomal protein L21